MANEVRFLVSDPRKDAWLKVQSSCIPRAGDFLVLDHAIGFGVVVEKVFFEFVEEDGEVFTSWRSLPKVFGRLIKAADVEKLK